MVEDIPIPHGTAVRIRFGVAVEGFLRKLAEQLQTNAEGVFFSQQNPKAGLGCCPFHLKLITSLDLSGQSCLTVQNILKEVGSNIDNVVQGLVLPVCTVDSMGLVSLKISSSDCLVVGKSLSQRLPGTNNWSSSHEDNLVVSIGSFRGPHTTAFESWLNAELKSNSAVFPHFIADILELSEECNFIQDPVRLSGIKLEQSKINNKFNSSINGDAPIVEDLSPLQKDGKISIEQRLLTSAASLILKIGGAGIIKMDPTSSSAANSPQKKITKYSIIPSEINKWQDQCSKIFTMLDGMLQAVGAKNFVNALDSVANPNRKTSSLSALLPLIKKNGFLELTQNNDLRIETKGTDGKGPDLEGVVVSLVVCTVNRSVESSTNGSTNTTPTPVSCALACFPVAKKDTHQKHRAIIALHISSDSISALGLQPLDDLQDFYLPFGFIDVKEPSGLYNKVTAGHNGPQGAVGQSRAVHPQQGPNKGVQSGNMPNRIKGVQENGHNHKVINKDMPQSAGGHNVASRGPNTHHNGHVNYGQGSTAGGGMSHAGDWICPVCKVLVFSYRPDCFKCHTLRPVDSSYQLVPRQPPKTNSKPEGDVRDGDWLCLSCQGHNFASKLACFTCRSPRPPVASSGEKSDDTSIVDGNATTKVMPGDWQCPTCLENVFAKRFRCYKCSTQRPLQTRDKL